MRICLFTKIVLVYLYGLKILDLSFKYCAFLDENIIRIVFKTDCLCIALVFQFCNFQKKKKKLNNDKPFF